VWSALETRFCTTHMGLAPPCVCVWFIDYPRSPAREGLLELAVALALAHKHKARYIGPVFPQKKKKTEPESVGTGAVTVVLYIKARTCAAQLRALAASAFYVLLTRGRPWDARIYQRWIFLRATWHLQAAVDAKFSRLVLI
jgi:hypothetical protein